jgi:hypothetical protein
MDRAAVLAKTEKGIEEVRSRAAGLPQKLRSLLIMVDGAASADQLIARFGGVPEIEAALEALIAQGFVVARPAPPKTAPTPSPAAQPPGSSPKARAEALAALTKALHDQLGPDADLVTARLERAKTRDDFRSAAQAAASMLEALRGAKRAEAFRDQAARFDEEFLRSG